MAIKSKSIVYYVVGANNSDESQLSPILVQNKKQLEEFGWKIFYGIILDRSSIKGIINSFFRLKNELKNLNPTIIHSTYGSMTGLLCLIVSKNRKLLVQYRGDDLLGTEHEGLVWKIRSQLNIYLSLIVAHFADSIIVVSNNLLDKLPKHIKYKTNIIPNGINFSLFNISNKEKERVKLGWSAKKKIVLFNGGQGSNQEVKNLPLSLLSIEKTKQHIPDIEIKIINNESRESVVLMMNAADCLLITSLHEGSPDILKEAMACNLPIVTVDCGDVRERLIRVYPSEICSYNADEIANSILRILNLNIRSNGRKEIMKQNLSLANTCNKISDIYYSLL